MFFSYTPLGHQDKVLPSWPLLSLFYDFLQYSSKELKPSTDYMYNALLDSILCFTHFQVLYAESTSEVIPLFRFVSLM